jgi:hypothetical protein
MRNPDTTGLGILFTGTLWVVVVMVGFCLTGCGAPPPNAELLQAKADAAKAHAAAVKHLSTEENTVEKLNKAIGFLQRAHEAQTEAAVQALLTRANEAAEQGGIPKLVEVNGTTQEAGEPVGELSPDIPLPPVQPAPPSQPKAQTTAYTPPVQQGEIEYTSAGSWRPPVPQAPQALKPPVPQAAKATVVKMKVKAMAHPKPSPQPPVVQAGAPTCKEGTVTCVDKHLTYWAEHNGVKKLSARILKALRRKESFPPNLFRRGADGEYGPMQVMLATAEGANIKVHLPYLNTVAGNTLAGARVWATCELQNPGPETPAILRKRAACYNGGQGTVLEGEHLIAGTAVYKYATVFLKIYRDLA